MLGLIRVHRRSAGGVLALRAQHRSYCRVALIAVADADGLSHFVHEYFAVADFAGARGGGQRSQHLLRPGVGDDHLHFHFRQEVNIVFLATVHLRVAFLPAVPADFGDRHAVHPDGDQSILDVVQFERLHNRFQFFHYMSPNSYHALTAGGRRLESFYDMHRNFRLAFRAKVAYPGPLLTRSTFVPTLATTRYSPDRARPSIDRWPAHRAAPRRPWKLRPAVVPVRQSGRTPRPGRLRKPASTDAIGSIRRADGRRPAVR